jgi:hypothetical protein
MTAFFRFMNEKRDELKEKHPDAKAAEIGKLAGAAWKALSASKKAKYEKMAADAKIEYAEALEKYNSEKESDDEKPSAKKASAKKASAKKVAEADDEADDEAEADDEEPKTEEELNKLTIPKLKELCKSYELAQTGNKAALVERLVAKLSEDAGDEDAGDEEEAEDEEAEDEEAEDEEAEDEDAEEEVYTEKKLNGMTVKELKEICTGLELTFKAVAKKADLIKQILENQGGDEAAEE